MNRLSKIIAYSITASFVLIVIIVLIVTYIMGYNVSKRRNAEIGNRDIIIERIESYVSANGRLPESLSEVGFEQASAGYTFKGIYFDYLILDDKKYIIEYTSEDNVLTQYISEEHRWAEEPDIYYIELPVNVDTIAAINKISTFEQNYNMAPIVDSVSFNDSHICPIDDSISVPDSIAYIRYLYKDGSIRSEGWITYSDDPEDDFSNEFGEWKYYDEEGNCYRKFWNYKENGKLMYKADR